RAFPELDLTVVGRSVADRLSAESPLTGLPVPRRTHFLVALAHGSVQRPDLPARFGLITPEEIAASGVDYLALGDWHSTRDVSSGGVRAWYSGAPEMIGLDEPDCGSVCLVTLGAPGDIEVVRRPVGRRRGRHITLDLAGSGGAEGVARAIRGHADASLALVVTLGGLVGLADRVNVERLREDLGPEFFRLEIRDESHLRLDDAGKSTLHLAFAVVLFPVKPSAAHSFAQWGEERPGEITMEFDADGRTYRLHKDFRSRKVLLRCGEEQWDAPKEVERRVGEVLGLTSASLFRATVHIGQWDLARVQEEKEEIGTRLARIIELEQQVRDDEALLEANRRLYALDGRVAELGARAEQLKASAGRIEGAVGAVGAAEADPALASPPDPETLARLQEAEVRVRMLTTAPGAAEAEPDAGDGSGGPPPTAASGGLALAAIVCGLLGALLMGIHKIPWGAAALIATAGFAGAALVLRGRGRRAARLRADRLRDREEHAAERLRLLDAAAEEVRRLTAALGAASLDEARRKAARYAEAVRRRETARMV